MAGSLDYTHMKNKWKKIESAPKDGTIIQTELGYVKFHDSIPNLTPAWYSCNIYGICITYDCGPIMEFFPKYWMPIPEEPNIKTGKIP
jgi:hypothetical protein